METIGVGIIGAGVRGVYCLGKAIAQLHFETGLIVTSLYDVIEQRSEEARRYLLGLYREAGIDQEITIYHDYDALLHDPECKIILITNYTNCHREAAIVSK